MNVRRVVVALASLLLLALTVPAFAAPRIVRLSYLAGDVRIDRNRAAGLENAILNMPVVEGTRILSNSEDARVEIEFENGSTIRMVGPGEINFRQLRLIDNGSKQTLVEVLRGIAYFDFRVQNDDDIRVLLRDRDLALRKSSHFRVEVTEPETVFSVYKGELELQGQSNLVVVKKNETLSLDSNDHDRYYLARSVSALEGDDFDRERDQYRNSYARSRAYEYSGVAYGAPYSYGLTDLAYYGAYSYYPGYGYLWRPAGFGIGWDPFSYGAWSYYPGSGWVYVSGYAWGWTPYRYGQWVNVPGYGWCWGPNGHVGGRGWYPVPVIRGPRYGHGPIPVPVAFRPPHDSAGPTVYVGGRRPDPRDQALRPNPAEGPHGRPGHFGDDARGGMPAAGRPVGPAANAMGNSQIGTMNGGAVTPHGGAIPVSGGAITPQDRALRPVVPGVGREPNAGDRDRERQFGHRVVPQGLDNNATPTAPAASRPIGVATPAAAPAAAPIPREPMRRYDGPSMDRAPDRSPRGMEPSMPRNNPPAASPQDRRPPAAAPAMAPVRSPQAFRDSAPPMRGGGEMRGGGSPAPSFHGGSGMQRGGGGAPASFRGGESSGGGRHR